MQRRRRPALLRCSGVPPLATEGRLELGFRYDENFHPAFVADAEALKR